MLKITLNQDTLNYNSIQNTKLNLKRYIDIPYTMIKFSQQSYYSPHTRMYSLKKNKDFQIDLF